MPTGSQATTPAEAFDLREGISLLEAAQSNTLTKPDGTAIELGYDSKGELKEGGVFDEKGRVPLHIIRPGIGKGRGRHLYEAKMLQEAAPGFTGWKMFCNHLSPEAKKAAGGLPRDVRDLGGRVQESWWDNSVAATADHDQGSVMGMVRPVKFIRELIDDDPALIEASISASATGVRPVTHDGQRAWLVEGINPRGSVDWVTEAGAGGRVAALLQESYADEEDVNMALLESMTNDEVLAHLQSERPELLQEAKPDAEDDPSKGGDGGADEMEEEVQKHMKKGLPRNMAEKAAKKSLAESTDGDPEGGEDVADITPEALAEALSASPEILAKALQENGEAQVFISSIVEAKVETERDALRAEGRADVDRAFQLAKLERTAHSMIAESRLPDSWQSDLRERFSIDEANKPSAALDVVDKVDDDGKVEKAAVEVLKEAVKAEIEKDSLRLREATQTRVRRPESQIAEAKKGAKKDEDDDPDKAGDKAKAGDKGEIAESEEKPYWAQTLAEAGVQDPEAAYALRG